MPSPQHDPRPPRTAGSARRTALLAAAAVLAVATIGGSRLVAERTGPGGAGRATQAASATVARPDAASPAGPATDAADAADDDTGPLGSGSAHLAKAEVRTAVGGPVVEVMPAAGVGVASPPMRNDVGRDITLDETALLACAHSAQATVLLAEGARSDAADQIARAAARARVSAVDAVTGRADGLLEALAGPDPTPAVAGLDAVCAERGFRR